MQELIEKRTENSKTYYLGDGKCRRVISGAVHYKDNYEDKSEQWKDIDLTFVDSRIIKAPYILEVNELSITLTSKKTGTVQTLTLERIGSEKSKAPIRWEFVKNQAIWRNAAPNTDVVIEAGVSFVRFKRILHSINALLEAKFTHSKDIGKANDISLHTSARDANGEPLEVAKSDVAGRLTEALDTSNLVLKEGKLYHKLQYPDGEGGLIEELVEVKFPIEVDPTLTVYATASDAYCRVELRDTWASAYGAADADAVDKTSNEIRAYQSLYIAKFYNHRSFLFFDTSALGAGAVIAAAVLSLYGKSHQDDDPPRGDLCVVESVSADPVTKPEYGAHKLKNTLGHDAAFDMGVWSNAGYNDITLNATGRGWINKTGITKFCLRCKGDVDNTAPLHDYSGCFIWSMEKGGDFRPKLVIDYTPPVVAPTVTTQAVSDIGFD